MDRDGAGAFPCHSGAGWPSLLLLRRANARSLRSHWDRCACQGAIRRWQLSWDLWRNPSCQNWVSYLSATWEWTLEGCPTPTGVFHCRPVKRRLCLIHCTSSWLSSTGRTVIRLREFFHNRSVMFHIVSYCFVTSWGMKDMNFKYFNEENSAMFDSNDSMRFCVLFWFLCRTCEGLWRLVKPWISSLVEKAAWLAANISKPLKHKNGTQHWNTLNHIAQVVSLCSRCGLSCSALKSNPQDFYTILSTSTRIYIIDYNLLI